MKPLSEERVQEGGGEKGEEGIKSREGEGGGCWVSYLEVEYSWVVWKALFVVSVPPRIDMFSRPPPELEALEMHQCPLPQGTPHWAVEVMPHVELPSFSYTEKQDSSI